jgi:hypothetical protein
MPAMTAASRSSNSVDWFDAFANFFARLSNCIEVLEEAAEG